MPNSPDGPQSEGPGASSKKSKRAKTGNGKQHAPAMPSTARALELEEELQAIQKGQTVAEFRETLLIESMLRRGHRLIDVWEEINHLREQNGKDLLSYPTFISLKHRFPDAFKLDAWKQDADEAVENALWSSATGAYGWEERAITVSDGKDAGEHVEIRRVRKRFVPNPVAAQFWLKNRRPEKWKDRTELALEQYKNLSDAELLALVGKELQTVGTTQQEDPDQE